MPSPRHSKQSLSLPFRRSRARPGGPLLLSALLLGGAACSGKDSTSTYSSIGQAGSGGGAGASGGSGGVAPDAGGGPTPQKLLILHTNDIHSHLMGYGPERDYSPASVGDDATRGGMARLATAIGRARAQADAAGSAVLTLDAGDFTMGTLFELLATQAVPELQLMQALGYDATTLGNHELDWTPAGLAAILQAKTAAQIALPILQSNLQFSHASGDTGDDALEALVSATGALQPKLVKTVGSLKVGLFGLLGSNAVQVTPQASPLRFEPIDVAAARMVTELRQVDQVDLVIALSHSGIDSNGQGEDADLAAAIPGIDVIVSGHTHDTLAEPVRVGQTWIVTAGEYTGHLGQLALSVTPADTPGGRATVAVDGYELLSIDDSIPGDATTQAGIEQYVEGLDAFALVPRGLAYRKVMAKTSVDLALPAYEEAPIGNLVSDAYRTLVTTLAPVAEPTIAVEAFGQLRAPLSKGATGEVWLADLFSVLPIGIGPDQNPGFPLVSFYLDARGLRAGMELGAAAEIAGRDVFLQVSGLKVSYDMSRPPFQRVSSLSIVTGSGEQPLDLASTSPCYRVVATNYVAGLLSFVRTLTGGVLTIVPTDADCTTPVDPTTRFVDADPLTAGVQELKHWQALLGYLSQFPDLDTDGIPDVPPVYGAVQGRIVKE